MRIYKRSISIDRAEGLPQKRCICVESTHYGDISRINTIIVATNLFENSIIEE